VNTKLCFQIGVLFAAAVYRGAMAESQPNVLFIVVDDLNTHVSTSGYPHIKTPAFDQLAETGMTFGRAYCQYPVCNSSRTSFLHSLYPQSTGVISNHEFIRDTRPGTASMPQVFKEAGYWTASTGKVFHNMDADPGELAWHEMIQFENEEMPLVIPIREAFDREHRDLSSRERAKLWKEFYPTIAPQTRGQKPGYGPSGLSDEGHRDGKNARQVVSWLEEKTFGDKPFFIAMGVHKPHGPFLAPDKYFDLYPQSELQFEPGPEGFWDTAPASAKTKRYEGFDFEFEVENDALRREYMQAYHACISFGDAQIGKALDALKKGGYWDNTLVVLISDHGYHLGDHFMWGKVTLFELCARVPMLMRVPGMTNAGSKSDGLVELVDLFPTLAELCGVEAPNHVQGHSLVPMLKDTSAPGKDVVYTVVTRGEILGQALRTSRWRYAKWADGEELYDLANDIPELNNLAMHADYASPLQEMRNHLERIDTMAASQRHQR
jgi:iduronate 2-sulfatase